MILYPNAKINLGLRVLSKRDDAYHDISSIILPIDLFDRMEISKSDVFGVDYSGLNFDTSQELVGQLINWLEGEYCTEPFHVHLHKEIPIGCGFGGGSSDLAFFANYVLKTIESEPKRLSLLKKVKELSSDAAFFIQNKTALVSGKGDVVQAIQNPFQGMMVYVVVPDFQVSTKDAYELVNHYSHGPIQLADLKDRQTWRDVLQNDFEPNLFLKHPFYKALKTNLYDQGAILACLTGSGSAYVALFEEKINLKLPIKGTWHSFI